MAKLQDDSQPRVDISPPDVISPKPGEIYDSPVPFELRPGSGGGGITRRKRSNATFITRGQNSKIC
ncbi:hypothetical protein EMIT0196MI5_20291 [Pseudomonas sp. IT-196MI5]